MTIIQRKFLEWIGYNDYEIQEVENEIKNGEKPLVFESEQYNAFENGYKNGLKAKVNFTTVSDYPFKNQWHYVKDGIAKWCYCGLECEWCTLTPEQARELSSSRHDYIKKRMQTKE